MTEDEFKHAYVRSFLEAYKSVVRSKFNFGKLPDQDKLLEIAKNRATIAWQDYLKENPHVK